VLVQSAPAHELFTGPNTGVCDEDLELLRREGNCEGDSRRQRQPRPAKKQNPSHAPLLQGPA